MMCHTRWDSRDRSWGERALRCDVVVSRVCRVHVRRTDKVGTEAAFHGLDEYMIYVEEYFNLLEKSQSIEQRAIYLATDDPNLHTEAKTK